MHVPGTVRRKNRLGPRATWKLAIEMDIIPVRTGIVEQSQNPKMLFHHGFKTQFCPASWLQQREKQGYAAVVYLRSSYDDRHVAVRLLCSKTRVAPGKQQSIPRLELLGACILARLMNTVQNSLPEEIRKFYWTDSKTTLC